MSKMKMIKGAALIILLASLNSSRAKELGIIGGDEYYDEEMEQFLKEEEDISKRGPKPLNVLVPKDSEDNFYVSQTDWYNYWPPKKEDGSILSPDKHGQKEWEKIRDQKEKEFVDFQTKRDAILKKRSSLATDGFLARAYPYCVDGRLPYIKPNPDPNAFPYNDPDLSNFGPLFRISQPRSGIPVVADRFGKPNIEHLENGEQKGPYIQSISFSDIVNDRIKTSQKAGTWSGSSFGSMQNWRHIYVKSRVPLEGLYIQAISYPMGLPFGEFNTDFDCDMTGGSDKEPLEPDLNVQIDPIQSQNPDQDLKSGVKRRIVVPCKYNHGNNNGDVTPTVFAYGGQSNGMPPRSNFRTHFFYSNNHCNYKMRMQFLVMAVKSFDNMDYEAFLTSTFLPRMVFYAGLPYPLSSEVFVDHLTCRENSLRDVLLDDIMPMDKSKRFSQMQYVNEISGPDFYIVYDGNYDNCVTSDVGLENGICPPSKICLNSKHPGEGTLYAKEYKDLKGRYGVDRFQHMLGNEYYRFPDYFVERYRAKYLPNKACYIKNCRHPKLTEPTLRTSIDPFFLQLQLVTIGKTFMEGFLGNTTVFFRGSKGTHVWSMMLAWFVLMAIGTFTARFYKETGGLDPNLNNGCFGIGFWLWVHLILMMCSLTFMWIGLLDLISIQRTPAPCNAYGIFAASKPEIKKQCRWRKKVVRYHKNLGIAAVVLYHVALIFAWARPDSRWKLKKFKIVFNFRKIFIWLHVLFAYIGKLVCIISVMMFYLPRAAEICNEFPIEVTMTECVTLAFFAVACWLQYMEDSVENNRKRKVFPVLQAIEVPTEKSSCYKYKVTVVVVSCIVHFILFVVVIISCRLIYSTFNNPGANTVGDFETFSGLFSKCKVPSTASDILIKMDRYFYSKKSND